MLHFGKIPRKFGKFWQNLRNFGKKTGKKSAIFNEIFEIRERWLLFPRFSHMDSKAVQRSALCRSRRELSNEYLLAKCGFDTAENEPCKVCPLSAYRSPRSFMTLAFYAVQALGGEVWA